MRRRKGFIAAFISLLIATLALVGDASPAHAGTHSGIQGPIYFSSSAGIQRVNPGGGGLETMVPSQFTRGQCNPWQETGEPAISKDGRRLAFTAKCGKALNNNTCENCPRQGHRYMFWMDVTQPGVFREMRVYHPLDGSWPAEGTSPTWSPDGRAIAYSRYSTTDTEAQDLYRLEFGDGSAPTQQNDFRLTRLSPARWVRDAEWSPDGRFVAYTAWNAVYNTPDFGTYELRLTDPNLGGGRTPDRVLDVGDDLSEPSWRPDSSRLVYSAGRFPTIATIDSFGNRTSRFPVFGGAPGDVSPTYAPSPDAGTQGDTILVGRGTGFYFIRGTESAASLRGPIPGGFAASWSVYALPLTTTPVPVIVDNAVTTVCARVGPNCKTLVNVALDPVRRLLAGQNPIPGPPV